MNPEQRQNRLTSYDNDRFHGAAAALLTASRLGSALLLLLLPVLPVHAQWRSVSKSQIRVTLGDVEQTKSGFLTVVGPKERAQLKSGLDQHVILQFRYRGPSKKTSRLASGRMVRQIGLKLRTKNTCNLLYVMWRIEPQEEIRVTLKRNPGENRHDECEASGYEPIAVIPVADIQANAENNTSITATDHQTHRLQARLEERDNDFLCVVSVDDREIWSGPIAKPLLRDITGPVGMRSDNGSFIFQIFVPDDKSQDKSEQ